MFILTGLLTNQCKMTAILRCRGFEVFHVIIISTFASFQLSLSFTNSMHMAFSLRTQVWLSAMNEIAANDGVAIYGIF
jgi:hypothetical protein